MVKALRNSGKSMKVNRTLDDLRSIFGQSEHELVLRRPIGLRTNCWFIARTDRVRKNPWGWSVEHGYVWCQAMQPLRMTPLTRSITGWPGSANVAGLPLVSWQSNDFDDFDACQIYSIPQSIA